MNYRREIDGLRAVAVVTVIAFHAGLPFLEGGFLGVDIFFVISGFLIYSIIIRKADQGTFSFAEFYERRARRLAPALIAVIAATIPAAWLLLDPIQMKDFGQSVFCATFFCANVLFWSEADYFAHAAELKPLLHTWSLSVEEQFYVVFPFLALFLARVSDRLKIVILTALLLSSFGAALRFQTADPTGTFYLLHTRAWELLAGAICAVAARHLTKPRPILADLGLVLITGSILLVDNGMGIPGLACAPAVLGACLILLFGSEQGITGRLLASSAFVTIGLLSYSAYLIHQPLLAFARLTLSSDPWVLLPVGLLALPFGYLSWRFIEQPFRKARTGGGFLVPRGVLIAGITLPVMLFSAFGVAMHMWQGIPDRHAPNGKPWSALGLDAKLAANRGLDQACTDGNVPSILASAACRTADVPKVLLWGDSFAMHLAPVLAASDSVKDKGLRQVTLSQCPPIVGVASNGSATTAADCIAFNDQVIAHIEASPELTHVVMSSPFVVSSRLLDAQGNPLASPRIAATEALRETLDRVEAAGAIPILVGPTPGDATDLGRCLAGNVARNRPLAHCDVRRSDIAQRVADAYGLLEDAAGDRPLVDLRDILCDDVFCAVSADKGIFLYRDWGHFSNEGAQWVGHNLTPFDAVLATPVPD